MPTALLAYDAVPEPLRMFTLRSGAGVRVFENPEQVSRHAAGLFTALAQQAVAESGRFTVALAGGSTPARLYGLLAEPPFSATLPWSQIDLFFGDERCVPQNAPESNFRMVQERLLSRAPIPANNVYRMPGELPPEEGAHVCEQMLRQQFGADSLPRFGLVLLGMGQDGHCASLFPRKRALHVADRLVVASEPGRDPLVPRLTLTFPVLNQARHLLFLVTGSDKAETLAPVLFGPPEPDLLPAQRVKPEEGTLTWLLDAPAAKRLPA